MAKLVGECHVHGTVNGEATGLGNRNSAYDLMSVVARRRATFSLARPRGWCVPTLGIQGLTKGRKKKEKVDSIERYRRL